MLHLKLVPTGWLRHFIERKGQDTVMGFLKIAESKKTIGEEINITTQKEISIGSLTRNSKFERINNLYSCT